jgi:Uma2 family endonuclease
MLAPAHAAITRAEYEEMPPGPPFFQLIEGQLLMSPSPFTKHQRLAFRLANLLSQFVETRDLGEVFIAPLDVFLNDINVYQPDIVFVAAANLNKVTEKGIEGAPDLCVEVLSQSTQRFDRTTKKKIFAQAGLKHYWLVDPEAKSISLFNFTQNVEEAAEVLVSSQKLRPAIFDGLEIDLARLFRRL